MNKSKPKKLKLIILFRKKSDNAFSIEELFSTILFRLKQKSIIDFEQLRLPYGGRRLVNKLQNIIFVFKRRSSLIHVTGEVYYTVLFNRNVIITIHDIASALKGSFFKRNLIGFLWLKAPCRIAIKVTVVSEASKNELIKYTGVNPDKVVVIPNPINENLVYSPNKREDCMRLLAIGTKSNKNLERLLKACENLKVSIHIIGKLTPQQQDLLELLKINYTNDFGIDFNQVITHYQNCDILTFVSTYEGFGVPIIEAQAIGRPVLTSKLSSMPEVAGDGALFVDPFSINSIKRGLLALINNKELRVDLVKKGLKNREKYRLEEIVTAYQKIYEEVM